MKNIIILGAGGHGRVAADIFESAGSTVIGLYDDDTTLIGKKSAVWNVVGTIADAIDAIQTKDMPFFVALGQNDKRAEISNAVFEKTGKKPVHCVSPFAIVSPHAQIQGEGVLIAPGAVVNVGSVLHEGVVVNTGATVDHDCVLSSFCSVQPGAHLGGGVYVGERSMIGIGASVRQYVRIGHDVLVGGGAMVVADIAHTRTVVGVPAKEKKHHDET